jgi:hypothetical protein
MLNINNLISFFLQRKDVAKILKKCGMSAIFYWYTICCIRIVLMYLCRG